MREPDRCPGVLHTHEAADGRLARIRIPGGVVRADQLAALSRSASELGDGHLELTARANIQIRGLAPGSEKTLSDRMTGSGLLPSATHEQARNIVASPLSGVDGLGQLDISSRVPRLDRAICADPALARLSGRFLFALDDGRGDVAALRADICLLPESPFSARLLLAGQDVGLRVPVADTIAAMVAAAHAFLAERDRQQTGAWRVKDLAEGPNTVAKRIRASCPVVQRSAASPACRPATGTAAHTPRAGLIAQPDGRVAAAVVVAFGRLTAAQAALVARDSRHGLGRIVVTPWRGLVITGIPGAEAGPLWRRLGEAALVTEPGSASIGLTTCAGLPGCAKALADVRGEAARAVRLRPQAGDLAVHWIGCGRGCGRPPGRHVEVRATGNGYDISLDGTLLAGDADVQTAAETIARARRSRP